MSASALDIDLAEMLAFFEVDLAETQREAEREKEFALPLVMLILLFLLFADIIINPIQNLTINICGGGGGNRTRIQRL